jgi:hypothetical protein
VHRWTATFTVLLVAALAPSASAQTAAPHVVASANGATARSSANQGEVVTCNGSGCTSAITAPARPPATWDGELPVSGRSVVEVTFGRPVELLAAEVVDRSLRRLSVASFERVDDQRWRVTLPAAVPDDAALRLAQRWTVDSERGRSDVSRTDFVGIELAAVLGAVRQPRRGGGAVAAIELRAPGLVDARLASGRRTLGQKSRNFATGRRLNLSVPLSHGARRLLAERRRLRATLTLTVRAPSGDPLVLEHRVTLLAKPR